MKSSPKKSHPITCHCPVGNTLSMPEDGKKCNVKFLSNTKLIRVMQNNSLFRAAINMHNGTISSNMHDKIPSEISIPKSQTVLLNMTFIKLLAQFSVHSSPNNLPWHKSAFIIRCIPSRYADMQCPFLRGVILQMSRNWPSYSKLVIS